MTSAIEHVKSQLAKQLAILTRELENNKKSALETVNGKHGNAFLAHNLAQSAVSLAVLDARIETLRSVISDIELAQSFEK